jgi:hypothetical protein
MSQAVTISSFSGVEPGQVSVAEGEIVTLVKDHDDGWCTVRTSSGSVGTMPIGFIEINGPKDLPLGVGYMLSEATKTTILKFDKLKRRLSTSLQKVSPNTSPLSRKGSLRRTNSDTLTTDTADTSDTLSTGSISPRISPREELKWQSHPDVSVFMLNGPEQQVLSDPRDLIIQEIRDSEKAYLESLNILNKTFLQDLLVSNLLSSNRELEGLNSILGIIMNFNGRLYQQLCQSNLIGKKFLTMTPFLKTYTDYFNRFEAVSDLLKKEKSENPKFAEWLKTKERKSKSSGGLLLSGYLIMPIQRVPRYSLILKELLKHTDQNHEDRQDLEKALEATLSVSTFLNKSLAERNNRSKLKHLTQILTEPERKVIIQPYRKYVFDGLLEFTDCYNEYIRLHFLYEQLYVMALTDLLVVCTEREDSKKKLAFTINVEHLNSIRNVDECESFFLPGAQDVMFYFENGNGGVTCRAASLEDKKMWVQTLESIKYMNEKRKQQECSNN